MGSAMSNKCPPMEIDMLRDPTNGKPLLKLWTDIKNGDDLLFIFPPTKHGFRRAYSLCRALRSEHQSVGLAQISIINAPSGTTFILD